MSERNDRRGKQREVMQPSLEAQAFAALFGVDASEEFDLQKSVEERERLLRRMHLDPGWNFGSRDDYARTRVQLAAPWSRDELTWAKRNASNEAPAAPPVALSRADRRAAARQKRSRRAIADMRVVADGPMRAEITDDHASTG